MSKNPTPLSPRLSDALQDFNGETATYAKVFNAISEVIFCDQVMLTSSFPRGGTQILQPAKLPESFSKAYVKGAFTEDAPSWQAIIQDRPVADDDCVPTGSLETSRYYLELMKPAGLRHVAAARVAGPVLKGYPGAIHLYRAEAAGPFTKEDLKTLGGIAAQLSGAIIQFREGRVADSCGQALPWERPDVQRQFIFDQEGRSVLMFDSTKPLEAELQQAVKQLVSAKLKAVNGEPVVSDRQELKDSHGEMWHFRVVVHKEFPALGEGPFVFICSQPPSCEWNVVKPGDFQADAEVARMVPTLRFMQSEFPRTPTLDEIAAKAHLSPFHFHRRFTELLGQTPKHFLLACQISRAKKMLMERKVGLAEIASQCGFAHQSHFTSRFKQATGLTPTKWRRYATDRFGQRAELVAG
jgi:AraC-like DNA-binding protein